MIVPTSAGTPSTLIKHLEPKRQSDFAPDRSMPRMRPKLLDVCRLLAIPETSLRWQKRNNNSTCNSSSVKDEDDDDELPAAVAAGGRTTKVD